MDVFLLCRRNPVLELRIATLCGACVRSSTAFCTSLFADRSGLAASAAGVILLCFAAERCKSHCNGGVIVANLALAAKFFHFGNIHFPFKFLLKSSS